VGSEHSLTSVARRAVVLRRAPVRIRASVLRARARLLLLLAVVLLVGACGVEPQRLPEPVPVERLPAASPGPTQNTSARGQVWGARDGRLVPVFVELTDRRPAGRVRALLALGAPGQTPRPPTVLPPRTRLMGVERSGDTVVLEFSEELRRVPVTTLPLALGQIVLTVTEQPRIRRVQVRSDGVPVQYVDATGRRITRDLVRADFADLVMAEGSGGTS
jgi:hypothetical protein